MATKKIPQSAISVQINRLAGRTVKTYVLKALIRSSGAILANTAQPANWLLFADKIQMRQIVADIEQSGEPSWQWLAKLVDEKYHQSSYKELLNLVNRNPGISVKQLVGMTDCTLAEARKVIDDVLEL
ncbi:MAG: hypothetical protein ACI8WB_003102 [Phenylobacterium sp.]|jgi:hypothetical protein